MPVIEFNVGSAINTSTTVVAQGEVPLWLTAITTTDRVALMFKRWMLNKRNIFRQVVQMIKWSYCVKNAKKLENFARDQRIYSLGDSHRNALQCGKLVKEMKYWMKMEKS
jgi:hypothetical protein